MDWKDLCAKALKKILVFTISSLGIKAVMNVMDGKDILGRDPNPEKTRVDEYKGEIHLGSKDYTVV